MSLSIKLEHENLLPLSETVIVPGGQYTALVRGRDYTIDYVNGILTILPTGIIPRLPGVMTEEFINLDITYKREVDFNNDFILESHIEIYAEPGAVESNIIRVQHSPVRAVQRVLNITTGEQYSVASFLGNQIYIAGVTLPVVETLTNQATTLRDREIAVDKFEVMVAITLPVHLTPAKQHPLTNVPGMGCVTGYKQLIRGGVDIPVSQYSMEITSDFAGLELKTGSTILRRSSRTLVSETEYTSSIQNSILTITLTAAGLLAIGRNSLYIRTYKSFPVLESVLYDGPAIEDSEHRVTFTERFISEVTTFGTDDKATLAKFNLFVIVGPEVDEYRSPTLIVTNQAGSITYVEGEDYMVDPIFGKLIRISTSPRLLSRQVVKVSYVDYEDYLASFTIAKDVVLVDYDYGTNSLDWSPSFQDTEVEQQVALHEDTRFLKLTQYPANETVTVTRSIGNGRIQTLEVVDVDITNRRVQIEPAPATDTYTVRYTGREQSIDPGTTYFVTYRYGARRDALVNNFAALLGLTIGTVYRTEAFDFTNGQSSIVLSYPPSDYERALIYITGDPDKEPLAEPLGFDPGTYKLTFTPVISSGNYTVEYPVVGFDTQQLRQAIIGLTNALAEGPTKNAVETMVEGLTGITPEVTEGLENGFILANDDTGDYLASLPAQISPPLSDGSSSIEYEPSRFDMGVSLREMNGAWLGYSAVSNIRIEEGSIEFLTGTFWDGDEAKSHYFVDMQGTDESTNRLVIYKNRQSRLVFEVHDKDSKLFRVTSDIRWIPRNEIFYLRKDASTVNLSYSPAYTIVDLDGAGQSDIFGAHRTEFVITPTFQGASAAGLGITTIVEIPNDKNYAEQLIQFDTAYRLRTLANIYEEHGGKLVVAAESSFLEGCRLYDNVLAEMIERGHDVCILINLPQDVISDEAREVYILERRNLLAALGIQAGDNDGIVGGYDIDHFATVFPALGLNYALAYKNPLSGEGLDGRTDVFRADTGPDFSIPNPAGELVYIPGDTSIQYQHNPMIVQSFIPITNSLLTAARRAHADVINSWYFIIGINDFTAGEVGLFDRWLGLNVDPLVAAKRVAWRSATEILQLFREYEKFLEINRNRIRFVDEYGYGTYGTYGGYGMYGYGGTQNIRALKWDEVTNTLTFDPVDKAGYYLFSYISGWSKYEEAEHLVTCTWKLHTRDGQPPFVKMFLDGELVNHKTWGDL